MHDHVLNFKADFGKDEHNDTYSMQNLTCDVRHPGHRKYRGVGDGDTNHRELYLGRSTSQHYEARPFRNRYGRRE